MFELAWTLLAQREYAQAAPIFLKMTEVNSWCACFLSPSSVSTSPTLLLLTLCNRSHGTYYFIAAGCHWSLGQYDEAQKLLDAIPGLIDKKKIGGKDLPTEVLIKKKRELSVFLSIVSY